MAFDDSRFLYAEDPDNPGWHRWQLREEGRFNTFLGPFLVRRDGARAVVRMTPHSGMLNFLDRLHGGALMGFIDSAMFAGARLFGGEGVQDAITVDLSVQMAAGGSAGTPIDAIVELTRETGRLMFLRGSVEQGDETIAGFIATIRKVTS